MFIMKCKLNKWQSVRYVFAAFKSLDLSERSLHDKYRYSEDTDVHRVMNIIRGNIFIVQRVVRLYIVH